MASLIFENFGGIAPKINPRRLAENLAQTAQNCLLESNVLAPMPTMEVTPYSAGASDQTIYEYSNGNWLTYSNDRDIARVQIANDTLERVVICDPATYPKIYSNGTSYRLGIPAPQSTPSVVVSEAPEDPNGVDSETISYVVTFVDAWGAEGPPSLPTTSVDRVRDTDITLENLPQPPNGDYNWGAGALKRIYRSNTGSAGAEYQFVKEVPISTATTTDNVASADLGELLPSLTWIGPPDDDTSIYPNGPMVGVIELPNGTLAGFAGNTLCFTEPYLYHAWPYEYRISFGEDIVGIAAIASGLLVTTVERPYIVTGVSPAAMAVTDLDVQQPCVSKRGMVDMGKYAIYPSPDGLILVEGLSATNVTETMFTREQWQSGYSPSTIHAYSWEGKYIAFYGGAAGFIFDPRAGLNAFVQIDDYLEAAYFDPAEDTLYVNDAGTIRRWGQGSGFTSYTWKSRVAVQARPLNFAFIRVQAVDDLSVNNVTVKIYADGALKHTAVLSDDDTPYTALPGGFRAKEWEIEITGINPISHIGLFESVSEAI